MGSLCVANIDNSPEGDNKVITGSLQGILRIYSPTKPEFSVEHHLLELDLGHGVLQLEAGHFTVNHSGLSLAVLHPRKLSVYAVVGNISASGKGTTHYEVRKLYDHQLERSSANMCLGRFGNGQSMDCLCVQSLDGQLCFFEGESVAFKRFLPNFLLPGPLAYVPETDSFVTANSAMNVECYKFTVLAASSEVKPTEDAASGGGSLTAGKKLQADWTFITGETVLDIKVVRMSKGITDQQADIVILGEHNVYLMSEQGQVRLQKRLDYPPASICCYKSGVKAAGSNREAENLLLGSSTGNLLVYKESQLCWCTACSAVPIALEVAEFGGQKGIVVTLSDSGALCLSYLGTQPPVNIIGDVGGGKELDYAAMDEEHRRLLATIRGAMSNVQKEPAERLQLRAQVPTVLDGHGGGEFGPSVTARIYMSFLGPGSADEVAISAAAPPPLEAHVSQSVVSSVRGQAGTPVIVPVTVSVRGPSLPTGNIITVTATYLKDGNNPRVASCRFEVPLVLLCSAVPPVKNAAFKITLETNRIPPPLPALFEDVLAMSPGAAEAVQGATGGNALSFQCHSGECVTVLVSKNAGRYRIQSESFPSMWILADELVRRLTAYYEGPGSSAGGGSGPFAVTYPEDIPLPDYFAAIDAHFEARGRVLAVRRALGARAQELRSVQKRVLARFKDKTPAPLGSLNTLLEDTHSAIMALADEWEQEQAALDAASAALAGATQLILLLVRHKFGLSGEAAEVLRSHLSPLVLDAAVPSAEHELSYHGWEETTEAALTQLLRTCLARSAKESAAQVQPLSQLPDTAKLKKHLALVLERLSKGGTLSAA